MRLLVAFVCCVLAGCAKRAEPLPVYGSIPAFELVSETGQPFDSRSLAGRIWVADFIYTTCTGPCPRMSALMQRVQSQTAAGVALVSFTVDPARDTPEALAAYARRYAAQPERWRFLTGKAETLHELSRNAFKLSNVDGTLDHSTRLVLVDGKGNIRGYYSTQEDSPVARLVADIQRLERPS